MKIHLQVKESRQISIKVKKKKKCMKSETEDPDQEIVFSRLFSSKWWDIRLEIKSSTQFLQWINRTNFLRHTITFVDTRLEKFQTRSFRLEVPGRIPVTRFSSRFFSSISLKIRRQYFDDNIMPFLMQNPKKASRHEVVLETRAFPSLMSREVTSWCSSKRVKKETSSSRFLFETEMTCVD